MIFQFPDLETLRLAITSGLVPAEVSSAPARISFDGEGRPSIESTLDALPRGLSTSLKNLKVKSAKDHYSAPTILVDCWPQALPVTRASMPEVTSTTSVLFELPVSDLPALVTEMLRLGNDRQSFITLASDQGDRVLLKVIGPPYYTLLRAIDRGTHSGENVTAFLERAPRVWVQIGFDHPLAHSLQPAEGQALMLRPERTWTTFAEGKFQDIYEIVDFQLPAAAVEWQESHLKGKLIVPLRLVPGNAADVPEMWVLTESAVDQLDALVRDADERLLSRLSFAVARDGEQTTIVLRVRASKLQPPAITLEKASAYKPYWKLPNLFLPVGKRLMPTLRRDAVRRLLADDPAQIVWLTPEEDGKFTPDVLPDEAFRPLEDWIDYIVDHDREVLGNWVAATEFDFDSFVCHEDAPDKPKAPPGEKPRKFRGKETDTGEPAANPKTKSARKTEERDDDTQYGVPVVEIAPSQLKVRRSELEKEFLALAGGLDEPRRNELWPELAAINSAIGDSSEAAICWVNAAWELPEIPVALAWAWLRSEDPNATRETTDREWAAALAEQAPSPNDIRRFVARVVYASRLDPVPSSFSQHLLAIREHLEKFESSIGLRATWLAWANLTRHGDVLALARARDRLLQRLIDHGLNKERDLAYFLRTAGEVNGDRMRLVRERALRVQRLVNGWHTGEDVKVNKPYVDLLFAFAFAKLGEVDATRDLIKQAERELLKPIAPDNRPDRAHELLFRGFRYRIEAALQGKPHIGGLPAELMASIDKVDEGRGNTASRRYVIERMFEQSWVLQPHERSDPYAREKVHGGELLRQLNDLIDIKSPERLEKEIRRLVRDYPTGHQRMQVYLASIMLAPRVGEELSTWLLAAIPAILEATPKAVPGQPEMAATLRDLQAKLLERSLFLAGHYDRRELVQVLFTRFIEIIRLRSDGELYETINKVARECLRSLRKLGLKDEIDQFMKPVIDLVVQGKSLPQLRASSGSHWPELLMALLHLSEAWLYFGNYDRARPFLDEARDTIYGNKGAPKEKSIKVHPLAKLVQTYITTSGQAPVDEALNRVEDLFQHLERLPNTFTTSSHFSRLHLNIVEDVVRSLVSDHMVMGEQARRWLDDDEYLVRRRIHADMRRLLAQSGL